MVCEQRSQVFLGYSLAASVIVVLLLLALLVVTIMLFRSKRTADSERNVDNVAMEERGSTIDELDDSSLASIDDSA